MILGPSGCLAVPPTGLPAATALAASFEAIDADDNLYMQEMHLHGGIDLQLRYGPSSPSPAGHYPMYWPLGKTDRPRWYQEPHACPGPRYQAEPEEAADGQQAGRACYASFRRYAEVHA